MKTKIFLIIILVLAAFLRLYQLGRLPSSYTPDELAQGYTAYSILKTGQDEWGSKNILNLKSYGDYKPPLQTFLMIPFVKLFGLTPLAVRLPNALLSIVSVFLAFHLAKKLFKNPTTALIAALLMAISPWALTMSRIALEANLLILIISTACLLFLNKKYLWSAFFFGLSLFTYHSSKVFTPLLVICLLLFRPPKIKKAGSFFIIFALFLAGQFFLNQQIANSRTNDIAIFNPTDGWSSVAFDQYQTAQNGFHPILARLFNNKASYLFYRFTKNYLSYLSPQFLVTTGAGETTYGMIPGLGVIGLVATIGILYGLIILLKNPNHKQRQSLLLLLRIILVAPLAASLAKGHLSANRASVFLPFILILAAFGLHRISAKKPRLTLFLSLLFVINSLYFLQKYFYQANQILAHGMLYGHKEALSYIQKKFPKKFIIYSRKLSEPQTYVMFFNRLNPNIVQAASTDWLRFQQQGLGFLDQLGQYQLENFTFKEINFASDSQLPDTVLVGRPQEFPQKQASHIIYYPDFRQDQEAIYIYENKP